MLSQTAKILLSVCVCSCKVMIELPEKGGEGIMQHLSHPCGRGCSVGAGSAANGGTAGAQRAAL